MKYILYSILVCLFATTLNAQLIIDFSKGYQQLALDLAGPGIVLGSITKTCNDSAMSSFEASNTNLGIDEGILLTSGTPLNAIGPNMGCEFGNDGRNNFESGDLDLDTIAGGATFDACVLEFDFIPATDTITFTYIFGSEEYPEYVCSINDVFAFFISGPGITGKQNVALIPGKTVPISINSVNEGQVGFFGDLGEPGCDTSNSAFYVDNCQTTNTTIEYDGWTVPLESKVGVLACNTYHLKLAIADARDAILDAGVFIKKESIVSKNIPIVKVSRHAIESCNRSGIIYIERTDDFLSDSLILHYTVDGSGISGTDYISIIDSVIIPIGDSIYEIEIQPISDTLQEGIETVILIFNYGCSGAVFDSIVVNIYDEPPFEAGEDKAVCANDSVVIGSLSVFEETLSYYWIPATGLVSDTISNPVFTYDNDTTLTFIVTIRDTTGCVVVDTINITSVYVEADAGRDTAVCYGQSIMLGGIDPLNTKIFYTWSPATNLDNTDIYNPIFQDSVMYVMDETYIFILNAINLETEFGCEAKDTIEITVYAGVQANIIPDSTIINIGESVNISVNGIYDQYDWTPSDFLSCTDCPNPVSTPTENIIYYLVVQDSNKCIGYDSVKIIVNETVFNVPQIFSPNHDDRNDLLKVIYKGIKELTYFEIYNRWGEIIFSSNDIDLGWDGNFDGIEQPVGVYQYQLSAIAESGETFIKNGNITLIR